MTCILAAQGTIELYFYGELPPGEHAAVEAHLPGCGDCREVLDDLRAIRTALAARPDVAAPAGGDWSGFMARLDAAVRDERVAPAPATAQPTRLPLTRRAAPFLAMAALLAVVTIGAVLALRGSAVPDAPPAPASATVSTAPDRPVTPAAAAAPDAGLVALSGQHFERSKLVLLGLTTMDPASRKVQDWNYERTLANTLLGDTRLYRQAAEERGMHALAGVMRDLELVLLQTSMSESPDVESLGQLQRLIRRRDLLTKMDVAFESGS